MFLYLNFVIIKLVLKFTIKYFSNTVWKYNKWLDKLFRLLNKEGLTCLNENAVNVEKKQIL